MTTRFATEITLAGRTCLLADPAKYPGAAQKANSYRCSTGRQPGTAYLLLKRSDVDTLDKTAGLTLSFTSTDLSAAPTQTTTQTFVGLYFVEARRMLRGSEDDGNAAFLVKLQDVRRILALSGAGGAQYNVRAAGIGQKFLEATRNSSSDWTWSTMIGDLWSKLTGSLAGSVPTLPFTPHGTPEDCDFTGVSAWEALHQVLDKLQMTTVYNPTDGTFSIVSLGAAQSLTVPAAGGGTEEVTLDEYAGPFTFNAEKQTGLTVEIPETIRVWFPTWHDLFGRSWDQAWDGSWNTSRTAKYEDVATSQSGAKSGSIVDCWDDLSAEYNGDGTLQNDTDLSDRADEIAAKWLQNARITPRHKVVIGIDSAVLPGSEIREVCWRQWGGREGGSVTEWIAVAGHTRSLPRRRQGNECLQSIFNVTLSEAMGSSTTGAASFTFDDFTGGGIGHDVQDAWANAASGMKAIVAWMNNRWQFLDVYSCDAVTG